MVPLTDFEATPVAEYLRQEAPQELERLESIDRLLVSCPEFTTLGTRSDPVPGADF